MDSDNPAYFGGYMNQNFIELFDALPQLTACQAPPLMGNSFEANLAGPSRSEALDAGFSPMA